MQNSEAYTTAYHVGQIIGVLLVLAIVLGLLGFFVFALVKALNTRKSGWIITTCVTGVPFALILILIMIGMVAGFKRRLDRSAEYTAASQNEPSPLLTAEMTSITGNKKPYQISLPRISEWSKKPSRLAFDYLFNDQDAYIGVIDEGIGVGTPEHACALTQKNQAAKSTDYSATTPTSIQIDSRGWLTYDATATVNGAHIKYRFYVYADGDQTIQIITWTGPKLFDHYSPVFDRVAKSFKLPQ